MSPDLYVIAGPNGAGKTTFAREFLPNYADCKNFINADLIAQGVSPFSPEAAAFRAGRLMLQEIKLYLRRGEDFGFETTLSGRSYLSLIRRLKKRGYRVHIFFLWVPTADLALTRVRRRVMEGGHDVPEAVVRRRFDRSIRNFLVHYRPLGDSWMEAQGFLDFLRSFAFFSASNFALISLCGTLTSCRVRFSKLAYSFDFVFMIRSFLSAWPTSPPEYHVSRVGDNASHRFDGKVRTWPLSAICRRT